MLDTPSTHPQQLLCFLHWNSLEYRVRAWLSSKVLPFQGCSFPLKAQTVRQWEHSSAQNILRADLHYCSESMSTFRKPLFSSAPSPTQCISPSTILIIPEVRRDRDPLRAHPHSEKDSPVTSSGFLESSLYTEISSSITFYLHTLEAF